MSIATELTTLNSTKQAIKQALIDKGVDLTGVNFAGYSAKIDALSTGGGSGGGSGGVSSSEWSQAYYNSVLANSWTRNSNWLAMPTLATKGFVGLMGIYATDNAVCTVKGIGGAYTVDWGDGVVENFASGTIASHIYTFANIDSATTQADGSRQVIVKAYPQSGQQFTSIDLNNKHSRYSRAYETNWLDIWLSTNSSTVLPILAVNGSSGTERVYMNELERFTWLSDGFTGTSTAYLFSGLRNLQNITIPATTSVTNMSNMFANCYSLQTIPLLNTAAVTDMSYMLYNCFSLQTIPLLDTVKVTDMNYMFFYCYSLQTIPLLNTAKVTNMSYMFNSCYSLQTIPLLNTAAVTNMSNMFAYCYSLQTIPLLDIAAVTNMSNMFYYCYSLQTIPLLNTVAVTNMSYMFAYCFSLQTIPLLNTAAVTNMSNMFNSCYSLQTIPAINLTNVTSANLTSIFSTCPTLSRIQATNIKYSFSVASCGLSATALNEIYTNLPTVTGQTITVTGNFGTTADNPSIATAKGWTVTG